MNPKKYFFNYTKVEPYARARFRVFFCAHVCFFVLRESKRESMCERKRLGEREKGREGLGFGFWD